MRKINPAYADLVVDKSDENTILHPIFGSQHDILAPPEVTVEDRVLHNGETATPCIIYPVPSDWWPYVTDEGHWELLREVGWQSRQDTSHLLNSFLNLAEVADKGITEEVRKTVAAFAKQWGPLWLCATPNHTAGRWFGPCYWGTLSPYWKYTQGGKPCSWCPAEEATTLLSKAQQAWAVIEAAKCVREGHAIPERVKQPASSSHVGRLVWSHTGMRACVLHD